MRQIKVSFSCFPQPQQRLWIVKKNQNSLRLLFQTSFNIPFPGPSQTPFRILKIFTLLKNMILDPSSK